MTNDQWLMKPVDTIQIDNPGLALFGDVPEDLVLVVTGLSRTGTSAAAELIAAPPVGLRLFHQRANHEDYELAELIEHDLGAEAEALIRKRPARWAMKRPLIYRDAVLLRNLLGDRLAWLFVFRDPLATSLREMAVYGRGLDYWLHRTDDALSDLIGFAAAAPEPKAFLSYEKLLMLRPQVARRLQQWILSGARSNAC